MDEFTPATVSPVTVIARSRTVHEHDSRQLWPHHSSARQQHLQTKGRRRVGKLARGTLLRRKHTMHYIEAFTIPTGTVASHIEDFAAKRDTREQPIHRSRSGPIS